MMGPHEESHEAHFPRPSVPAGCHSPRGVAVFPPLSNIPISQTLSVAEVDTAARKRQCVVLHNVNGAPAEYVVTTRGLQRAALKSRVLPRSFERHQSLGHLS